MELILIRHTKVNIEKGICYGFTNVDVATSFEDEAIEVQKQIKNIHSNTIWSSPLNRCMKLTKFLFPNTTTHSDDRLKELNFGAWEMQTWEHIYKIPEGIKWMDDYVNERCPLGESFLDQYTRIKHFLIDKIISSKEENAVIVAHGGTIRAILCYIQNIELSKVFDINIDYGSVTKITIK